MSTAIIIALLLTLLVAGGVAFVESASGYLGDSSMVPGIVLLGMLLVAAIVVAGYFRGSWEIVIQ